MRSHLGTLGLFAVLALASPATLAAADRAQSASGTISRLDAAHQTLVVKVGDQEMKFVWNSETRINGVLAPGAKVTVRYAAAAEADGYRAYQISVGK